MHPLVKNFFNFVEWYKVTINPRALRSKINIEFDKYRKHLRFSSKEDLEYMRKLFFIYKDWYLPRYEPKRSLEYDKAFFDVFKDEWKDYEKHLRDSSLEDSKEVREDWFSYHDL